jgi:maltokinase
MTFEDSLASWLPAQRWFSGKGTEISAVTVAAETTLLDGDPELRHLIVDVTSGGQQARYQVLAGARKKLPAAFAHLAIGPDDRGWVNYDALHDEELTGVLLRGIDCGQTTGAVRLRKMPGAEIDTGSRSIVLTAEQSNTSLIYGDAAILKVLRKLFPGVNPDLELTSALAERHSPHIAQPLGWIETSEGDEPVLLAVLSQFLPSASDGWQLAATSVRDLYADDRVRDGERLTAQQAGGDFAGEAERLGAATAEVHADLAAAFGVTDLPPERVAELARQMSARLEVACTEVPALREYADKIGAHFAAVTSLPGPVRVQRVHGDYHLGQVLRTTSGWVILDFEGEPAVPLAQRRAPSPALRDVAGMLRSFDYVARHQLIGRPDAEELEPTARDWVHRSQAAFCAGYAAAGGSDPRASEVLLTALMLDKAVYEAVYEARYRPSWLPIPLGSIATAL